MLAVIKVVSRVADVLAALTRWATGLCLLALLVAVSTQIIGRHVLHSTPAWAEVFASVMMAWLSLLGVAYAVRVDENMVIALLPDVLSGKARRALLVVISLTGLVFATMLLDASIEQLSLLGHSTIIGLNISTRWLFMSAPIAAGLMIIFLVERTLLALATRDGPTTGNETTL